MTVKKKAISAIIALIAVPMMCLNVFPQTADAPVDYLEAVIKPSDILLRQSWEYMSAASHSKNPKTIENTRISLVKSISDYIETVKKMKSYKNDDALRQSALKYLNILLNVTKHDYEKIVDMKEVSEQSYDSFEAYILAQKKANDRLEESSEIFTNAQKSFAAKYKIILTFTESDLAKKIKKGSDAIDYYNKIHLILFKSLKQEAYLIEANKTGDIGKIEQNRKTLSKYASDCLKKLSQEKKYDSDGSLIEKCKEMLQFYKSEADEKTPVIVEYVMLNESFEKTKKAFDLLSDSDKTQEKVDRFNEKVKELNAAVNKSNSVINELNGKRNQFVDDWNNCMAEFVERHVPN